MKNSAPFKCLALFLTYGNSLVTWQRAGILERELALYESHARQGIRTLLVSYGDRRDEALAARFPFLTLLHNRRELHPRIFALTLPLLFRKPLLQAQAFKTNQLSGAHIARRCAKLCKRPLVVRQGFGLYEDWSAQYGENSPQIRQALKYEKRCLRAADAIVYTTPELAERAILRQNLPQEKISIIPNYLLPGVWSPPFSPREGRDELTVGFYGRFAEQKNLASLIQAAAGLPVRLHLIGAGPQESMLRNLAGELNVPCEFINRLPHNHLGEALRQCDIFALPSHYEGHPKSLIEAMAFGMPVLAADSPGIREQVADGETALVVPNDPEGLRKGLKRMLESPELREKLGRRARKTALEKYSLETVAEKERRFFNDLLADS